MFGFSLAAQLFQGSAYRTWNRVIEFTNLLWYKFNHTRHSIMPRSRRRHHTRSRSRSRSHSHDRDREPKRRRIDSQDSPIHKRSVSEEPDISKDQSQSPPVEKQPQIKAFSSKSVDTPKKKVKTVKKDDGSKEEQLPTEDKTLLSQLDDKLNITPKKTMSPKQMQKKLESEKKRQEKQQEREERERKKQEEKAQKEEEKNRIREEKEQQKQKERDQKLKEREEKEAKRKEKEEKEELKRKEREQEKLKKQQEIDEKNKKKQQEIEEKNKKKQKEVEKNQKSVVFLANFFVPKKSDGTEEKKVEGTITSLFKPFEVKSDMRMPPLRRNALNEKEKQHLLTVIEKPDAKASYFKDLKSGNPLRKSYKTWPYEEDDVMILEEDFGDSICEDKPKTRKIRSKFFKFHENRRPPYCGTWRKKSTIIKARNPFVADKQFFDYEVDSDDDWEEEEQGESLNGSDDEEKENEAENDDYEVDNEFFVPHGHLSDDEIDDESLAKLSPESLKQKLKLLKDEFDQDMQTKTNKIKPRSIGCVWYNKNGSNVDDAIDRVLRPLAMITNGTVIIKKRAEVLQTPNRRNKNLSEDLIPPFLKHIHGQNKKKRALVEEFITKMESNGTVIEMSKVALGKTLSQFAQWKKCSEEGPLLNKQCWIVEDNIKKKYNVELSLNK